MKLLIIGAKGKMGKNHVRVSKKLLRTAVHTLKTCDIEGDTDYSDYKKAIKEFIPTHVIIATPTPTHGEILDYCIKMNVFSVLVEKPIIDGYDAMKYMDVKTTRIMVGHIERYNTVVDIMKNLISGKEIDTIICTRSGLLSEEEDYNLHLDLCIHDSDVCQLLTNHLLYKAPRMLAKNSQANSCNLFTEINGVDCFLHADKKSPHKRREIKVMGPGYIIEADYMNQRLWHNGLEIHIGKSEPLLAELDIFFKSKFTKEDLKEAIFNLKIVRA